ncbi:MAG: hypothetical protein K8R90_08965 [Candidatus Cloacimonetes bacterium]|nr:hypothetical protein [Candidatus Cloacimonadota bacterium]
MEGRYIKDFAIAIVFVMIIVFGVKDFMWYQECQQYPAEPDTHVGISDDLKNEIKQIETSIQDRKNFVFTVTKDPLEQNLIVKTIVDYEMQWRREVESQVRLAGTYITHSGQQLATIEHKGIRTNYHVGDAFEFGTISSIQKGKIVFQNNGYQGVLEISPIPEKPAILQTDETSTDLNW